MLPWCKDRNKQAATGAHVKSVTLPTKGMRLGDVPMALSIKHKTNLLQLGLTRVPLAHPGGGFFNVVCFWSMAVSMPNNLVDTKLPTSKILVKAMVMKTPKLTTNQDIANHQTNKLPCCAIAKGIGDHHGIDDFFSGEKGHGHHNAIGAHGG